MPRFKRQQLRKQSINVRVRVPRTVFSSLLLATVWIIHVHGYRGGLATCQMQGLAAQWQNGYCASGDPHLWEKKVSSLPHVLCCVVLFGMLQRVEWQPVRALARPASVCHVPTVCNVQYQQPGRSPGNKQKAQCKTHSPAYDILLLPQVS